MKPQIKDDLMTPQEEDREIVTDKTTPCLADVTGQKRMPK
jgi:hypothetical protein